MDKSLTHVSSERLLLNAESFGFGPSAAVASIFPHVRERFEHIGYVGSGHTLDMQTNLDYDAIYDLSNLKTPERDKVIRELSGDYDLFFTAMDFPALEEFSAMGVKTAGYDALAWYWPSLPEGSKKSDLYLAQNFFGVRERLEANAEALQEHAVVPPLVASPEPRRHREHVLINLGGLQNPFWSLDDATMYARKVTEALGRVLPRGIEVKICTSTAIAEKLGGEAQVYAREQMKEVLASSRFAWMTPGLGNIYDSAVYDIPTIWLPPANDSQGQQLALLTEHDMIDAAVDWSHFGEEARIDYWAQQSDVLDVVTTRVHEMSVGALEQLFNEQLGRIDEDQRSKTTALIQRFGSRGDLVVAERLHAFALRQEQQHRGGSHA